ncbi:MAG: MFS transporter, partial [Nitrospinota bacterium]
LGGAALLGVVGAGASAWALRRDAGAPAAGAERGLAALVRVARRERAVLIPCLFTFCERLTVGLLVSSFALYLAQVLGRPPSAIGLLMSLVLFPFALLCYPFGRLCRVWRKSVMVAGGSILYGLALGALAWVPPDWLPAWMVLLGVVSAVNFAPSLAMVADLAGPDARSTAMGAFNAAGSLGFLLGPLVGGAVVQWASSAGMSPRAVYGLAFLAGGGLTVLTALAALPPLVRLVRAGRTT